MPRFAALRFERRCVACLEPCVPLAPHDPPLCPDCRALLPRRPAGHCPLCGEPSADPDAPPAPCGTCLRQPPPWDHFCFYGIFEGLLRELLLRAKFHGEPACLNLLGRLLAKACAGLPRPDAIAPMPLHPTRLRERGFNQCREIAKPLARAWGVPIRDDLIVRVRHTPPQTGLDRDARRRNLVHAFQASPKSDGLRILLVDDTATTTSSLRFAVAALLKEGAAAVDVGVVARTSGHGEG